MKKNATKKKNTYGDSYRVKKATIALIDRLDPSKKEMPFNTKLFSLLEELANLKGIPVVQT